MIPDTPATTAERDPLREYAEQVIKEAADTRAALARTVEHTRELIRESRRIRAELTPCRPAVP